MTDNMTNNSMTNDKPTMKVYTEDQVIKIIEKSRETGLTAEFLILTTTPKELPTWDDVKKAIELARGCRFSNAGIEWKISDEEIIEQLKGGGNK